MTTGLPDIRLTTDRLILRPPVETDFPAVEAFMMSDRTEFVGGKAPDQFAAWRAFMGSVGHWVLRGFGFFTVLDRTDDRPLGRVGIVHHVMWPEPELGWHMFDGAEGRGYAFEAALAVRDWARRARGLGPLISQIHPDNHRSRRLAERLGAVIESRTTLLGHDCLVYRHPQEPAA